jgi:DivIVA domain-containing protein
LTAWFDEEDRLTPEELQSVLFPAARLGRRGYEEEPVRQFLREVHAEFVQLVSERASLWQEVQRLRRRILAGAAGRDPQRAPPDELDAIAAGLRIPSAAAGRHVAGALAHGDQAADVRLRREDVIREAQHHAERLLEDAHAKARQAAVFALNGAAPPQSDQERRADQAELAYLRTYSDVYRAHLRAYTEGVLRGVEEWEREVAASLRDAAPEQADQRSIGP